MYLATELSHHHNISCQVRANITSTFTDYLNTTRFISNSVPFFDDGTAVILPSLPDENDELNCNTTRADLHDQDPEDNLTLTKTYNWANSSNGIEFTFLNFDNYTFPSGNTTVGQFWKCTISASDSWNTSSNITSASVELGSTNTAPIINAVNITTNRLISDSTNPTNNNSNILIGVNWTDADDDNATIFACKTNSFTGSSCTDGAWGTQNINITLNATEINHTLGGFSTQDNTLYVFAFGNNTLTSASKSATFEINFPPPTITLTDGTADPNNNTQYSSSVSSANLAWAASTDSNSDTVSYIIHADSGANPQNNIENTSSTSFLWSPLPSATWYWKIQPVDEHGYKGQNSTIFQFSIAAGAEGPSGGGPSPAEPPDIEGIIQAAQVGLCGNKACEEGENLFNCPIDCAPVVGFNFGDILNCFNADDFDRCVFKEAGFVTMLFFAIFGIIIFGAVIGQRRQKKSKK